MQRLRTPPRFTASATLGDLIRLLRLRYGEGFLYSLQNADGTLIGGDVAIIISDAPVHDLSFPLGAGQKVQLALPLMIVGGLIIEP